MVMQDTVSWWRKQVCQMLNPQSGERISDPYRHPWIYDASGLLSRRAIVAVEPFMFAFHPWWVKQNHEVLAGITRKWACSGAGLAGVIMLTGNTCKYSMLVPRWQRASRPRYTLGVWNKRVIYLRDGYSHECFSPLWLFVVILWSVKRRQSDGVMVETTRSGSGVFFLLRGQIFSVWKWWSTDTWRQITFHSADDSCLVPIRSAISAWVKPASLRAAAFHQATQIRRRWRRILL